MKMALKPFTGGKTGWAPKVIWGAVNQRKIKNITLLKSVSNTKESQKSEGTCLRTDFLEEPKLEQNLA